MTTKTFFEKIKYAVVRNRGDVYGLASATKYRIGNP